MSLQYRVAPDGQVRDIDEGKRHVLVSIPAEVIDSYNTDFARDCFDDFLSSRLPVLCWQHQRAEPVGRAVSHQRNVTINEFVAQFSDFDAVPRARQAFAQIRDGEITDFSFGFDQAKSIPHPQTRGAIRFTHARMPEISPVTIGAIPGAVAVGIRAEAEIGNVRALLEIGAIDEAGANEMLRAAGLDPLPRQRIEVSDPRQLLADAVKAALADTGERALTITLNDDGSVSTSGAAPTTTSDGNGGDGGDPDQSPADLAQAIDAACDAADALLDGDDLTSLPDNVQQALQLYTAASVAADELLDALGLPDPDEDAGRDTGELDERADKKPYGDVDYADPKNGKYPVDTVEHIKAAWSYIHQKRNQSGYSADELDKIKGRILAAAKRHGVNLDASKREPDDGLDLDVAAALAVLDLRGAHRP